MCRRGKSKFVIPMRPYIITQPPKGPDPSCDWMQQAAAVDSQTIGFSPFLNTIYLYEKKGVFRKNESISLNLAFKAIALLLMKGRQF